MTDRLYYENPYLYSFDAVVVRSEKIENGCEIWLDRSAFYPTSGGQPYDFGTIGEKRVVNVEVRDGDVVHTIAGELGEGECVHCNIDAVRRRDHMQQHCGEHMLAYLVWKHFGGFTHGLHIGEEFSTIDVTMPNGETHLTDEQLVLLEEEWNEWIQQDEIVHCWFPDDKELAGLPLRKESSVKEHIRIVHIAPNEYVACGGTHPRRTGEVGCGRILDARPSRGKLRISFVCGMRAVRDNRKKTDQCLAAAEQLSTHWSGLAEEVRKLSEKASVLGTQVKTLQRETAYAQMEKMLPNAPLSGDGKRVVAADFANVDMAAVREAASDIAKKHDCYALASVQAEDGVMLTFVRGPLCTIPMGKLLSDTAKACNGKGGGRPDFAQGSAQNAKDALAFAVRTLVSAQ